MLNVTTATCIHDVSSEDILDSRDLEELIDSLTADGIGQDIDAISLRKALKDLRTETEGSGWGHGIVFIRDSYFEDYARELADDIGAINRGASWPNTFIDWERAAEALQQDYSSVEIGGIQFWYQEA